MDALLVDINQAGLGRGLQFELFKPAPAETKREFYAELFGAVPVLPVTSTAAALAADAAARAARSGSVKAPDALIAGVALEHALPVVTADADFLALGPVVELVRAS